MINLPKIKEMFVKHYFTLSLIVVFLIGFTSNTVVGTILEQPLTLQNLTGNVAYERSSPSDYITEDQIKVYENKVVLDVPNVIWATFEGTNSMDPVIDETAHGLEIIPESCSEINIGDIISYTPYDRDANIIHRVVSEGFDEEGRYFVLKGDNNPVNDPEKVRCDQVKRKLIGILY